METEPVPHTLRFDRTGAVDNVQTIGQHKYELNSRIKHIINFTVMNDAPTGAIVSDESTASVFRKLLSRNAVTVQSFILKFPIRISVEIPAAVNEVLCDFYYLYYLIELQMGFTWWQWYYNKTQINSMALVRKRTIPTERPPHVGEVSANLCR
jgi:hypothetical protein